MSFTLRGEGVRDVQNKQEENKWRSAAAAAVRVDGAGLIAEASPRIAARSHICRRWPGFSGFPPSLVCVRSAPISLSLSVCVCVSVHRSAGWEPPPCSRVWLAAVAGREENLWRGGDEKEVTGTVFFTWGGQQCSRSLSVSQSHITLPSQAQSDPVYVAQGSRGSLGKIPRVQVALWFWLLYCRSMCRSSEVVQTVLRPEMWIFIKMRLPPGSACPAKPPQLCRGASPCGSALKAGLWQQSVRVMMVGEGKKPKNTPAAETCRNCRKALTLQRATDPEMLADTNLRAPRGPTTALPDVRGISPTQRPLSFSDPPGPPFMFMFTGSTTPT